MASFIQIVENNKDEIKGQLDDAIERALEAMGMQAENHVKMYETAVDTGTLRNSITHAIEDPRTVAIGTNVEYAPYVEYGTGAYATQGSRAKTIPWRYQDESGQWHITSGIRPVHFLQKGIMNHLSEYAKIAEQALRGF